jgi:hypothetical protein
MIEIVFDLNQVITKIQGNIKEPFKNVIDRYIQKSNYKRDELCFIGNGEIINVLCFPLLVFFSILFTIKNGFFVVCLVLFLWRFSLAFKSISINKFRIDE